MRRILNLPSVVLIAFSAAFCLSVLAGFARGLPNPKLTPGAVNADVTPENMDKTICNQDWSTKSIRPPVSYTNRLKRQQIEQYGYADKNMQDVEEDHLIPLTIGGNPTDPKNLWPQPWNGPFGAHTKDKLEVRLHSLVCHGTLPLRDAQKCIATDWIACYRRYIGPLGNGK